MARIIYGSIVTNIRGSVGGTTFQKNAYGFTVKNKPNIIKPNTFDQQTSKSIIAFLTTQWTLSSDSFRTQWNTYAAMFPQFSKHNPSAVLSGFAVYLKRNYYALLNHGITSPFIITPSLLPVSFVPLSVTAVNNGSSLVLNFSWETESPIIEASIFTFPSNRQSNNFLGSRSRFMGFVDNSEITFNATDLWLLKWGVLPAVGSDFFIKITECGINTGAIFAPSQFKVVVVASL